MTNLEARAADLARRLVAYCDAHTLSLDGMAARLASGEKLTVELLDAIGTYCNEHTLSLKVEGASLHAEVWGLWQDFHAAAITPRVVALALRMLSEHTDYCALGNKLILVNHLDEVWLCAEIGTVSLAENPKFAMVCERGRQSHHLAKIYLDPSFIPSSMEQALALGYEPAQTGGHCTAYEMEFEDGTFLQLTDADGSGYPDEPGLWDEHGLPLIGLCWTATGEEVLGGQLAIPTPTDAEIEAEYTDFEAGGKRWSFNADSVCAWNEEDGLGFEFAFYHGLTDPTVETVIAAMKAKGWDLSE